MCINPDHKLRDNGAEISTRHEKLGRQIVVESTHSAKERNTKYDLLLFLGPALFAFFTPIYPIFIIGCARILSTRTMLSLHYMCVDKDNYDNKLSSKQLKREKDDYLVGTMLHMYAQIALQIIFPGMFFTDNSAIYSCAVYTFWSHVLVVEPLYYVAHRWLHFPQNMKAMHGFHHLSIKTLPSTSLVQNFHEHFVYIATFGPAFLLPFLISGKQHWAVVGAYLVIFDAVNAYGHMNIRINNWLFNSKWSPLRYLFYTPEFHLGHHAYFRANYALFMPFWDFAFGTHREYKKKEDTTLPSDQQDFVFIGHNGGLGHLLTCPEFSVYNVYDKYCRTFLPIQVEFLLMHVFCLITRLFAKSYSVSRYLINGTKIGRIICILRTPIDFMSPKSYSGINDDIINLIKREYKGHGTRYFGLGNLTKMKQVNDGGRIISDLVKADSFLQDKNIRIWTGDTLTAASVYNQIIEIPGISEIFFIGANGKIGNAVCRLLAKNSNIKVRVFSSYESMKDLPNVSYTQDLSEMLDYKVVITGKYLPGKKYNKALREKQGKSKTRFILDYTVPFIPIDTKHHPDIKHLQIGILRVTNKTFLRGHFDICMGHEQNHIYPCHAGCIINTDERKEADEIGDINLAEMQLMWKKALCRGFQNKIIDYYKV